MMKRRYLLLGILGTCLLAVLGVLATLPESGVTKATFERVTKGMTKQEVDDVVGMPPTGNIPQSNLHREARSFVWTNPDASGFHVVLDEQGRVCETAWHESTETMGEKLRRWVRWPWW